MNHAPGTVAGAVERQGKSVEKQAAEAKDWFGRIAAGHVNPDAFVQLSLAQLNRVKNLHTAANANPRGFLSAMAQAARDGLMPGDTCFYLPFQDKVNAAETGGWNIVYVRHWTGEVELMYRSGEVEAVVIEVVRENDQFAWEPSTMRVPHHVIAANDSGQVGLAEPADRGKLTGVYCYCRLINGGTTYPTVMRPREVRKHYDKARTKDFWGDWPKETDTTEDMWRKTAAHKHRGSTPTSPEYRVSVTRATAEISAPPAGIEVGPLVSEEIEIDTSAGPAALMSNGGTVQAGAITATVEGRRTDKPMTKGDSLNRLGTIFKTAGLHGPQWAGLRRNLSAAGGAADGTEPREISGLSDLTAPEARLAVERIEALLAMAGDRPAGLVLLWWAEDIGAWDREQTPPPPWFIEAGDGQDGNRGEADRNAS